MANRVNSISVGEGPDVVLVHGVLSSTHCWDHTIPALVAAGFRCHALDILGHGESYKPSTADRYHSSYFYQHFEEWVSGLGLQKPFYLMGHSLGGYLSLKYALQNPAAVKALALIAPYFTPAQITQGARLAIMFPKIGSLIFPLFPRWVMRVSAWYFNNTWKLNKEAQYHLANDHHRAHPYVLFYGIPSIEDLTPKLHTLKMPLAVIWGEGDRSLQTNYFDVLQDSIPQAEGYEIAGTGHVVQLTAAKIVNQHVLNLFLKRDS